MELLETNLNVEKYRYNKLKDDTKPYRDNYPIVKKGLG